MTILNEIKNLVEVDVEETIFDNQLLFYANSGISYLINNGIPINNISLNSETNEWEKVDKQDIYLIIKYLYLHSLQQFDQEIVSSTATNNFIEAEKLDILTHLKMRYRNEEQ